jgi:predicted AAA+ superfamily ATPase
MLERKIMKTLIEWKQEKKKPCLLVRGARQVGKTYIIDQFANNNYESYIYINFEISPEYKSIFEGNLDIQTLIMQLEVTFPEKKIIPNKTILFLDEIQNCPNARVALKSFSLDGRIDVIASRFFTWTILQRSKFLSSRIRKSY